ncbi:MAG: aldehyde ferredoxin oxidoreductase family protein [Thermoleophilia bacterium]|jgi:aldehyde:ferredoxin oxidoreductase|nr:aldehyde ferredoxin oxidoreductase family protein [Thermoleophilia bacterium]
MTHLGDILDIDLATGAGTRRPFDEAAARSILGGRGFGVLELWRSTGPGTDPLSPSNPLILAPGLLTGTGAPTASRLQVTARSPLTGLLGSSNVGGGFGFALADAGLAALVLHGAAPRFSWLSLSPSGVELHDARDLVGLETFETQAAIAAQLPGPHGEALVIGPAGERLLPLACLVSQRGHAAGRTGLGAVLGAKNLKAIAVAGGAATPVKTGELAGLARAYVKKVVAADNFRDFHRYGSTFGMEWGSERGVLATRNFAAFRNDGPLAVDSAAVHQFFQQRSGCRHCPVQCKAEVRIAAAGTDPGAAGADLVGQRPDFEPLVALGPKLGIDDPAAVVRLHNRCDALGLDSISAGGAMAFAFDVYDRGIITAADTDGVELRWGDADAAGALLEGMASGEGFAGLLGHGVQRAATALGRGTHRYAYHVKGLELSAFDPRAAWATALGYAVSSRGADYTSIYPHHEFDLPAAEAERLYGSAEAADPLSPKGKAALVRRSMIVSAAIDALGLCKVPVLSLLNRFDLELEAELTAFAGLPLTADELFTAGERIVTLERLFNLRCGVDGEADRLPVRFTERRLESLPEGGGVVELDDVRHELYELLGWTGEGIPLPDAVRRLDLDSVVEASA